MSDSWDEMRRAKEEQYFEEQNKAALSRLKARTGDVKRPSPITGKPMEQITVAGVIVDRCQDSGGVWLDAGELEQIIKASKAQQGSQSSTWLDSFLEGVLGAGKKR